MAQKSLPILNKVNTSMIWYTTYYYKHYKWLSSQNLYLLFFFNKLFVYLDFLFFNLMWVDFYSINLYHCTRKARLPKFTKQRFFKPVTSYLVTINTKTIFFNIYYKTSLEKFQSLNNKTDSVIEDFRIKLRETSRLSKLCIFR